MSRQFTATPTEANGISSALFVPLRRKGTGSGAGERTGAKLWPRAFALVIAIQMLSGGCVATMPDLSFEGTMRVRVIDTTEKPVAGVEVLAQGALEDALRSLGRTGSDGNLQKEGMFSGSTLIRVEPPAGFVTAPNQSRSVRVNIEGDETTTVVFRLSRSPA